jgi:hypothetical protein
VNINYSIHLHSVLNIYVAQKSNDNLSALSKKGSLTYLGSCVGTGTRSLVLFLYKKTCAESRNCAQKMFLTNNTIKIKVKYSPYNNATVIQRGHSSPPVGPEAPPCKRGT